MISTVELLNRLRILVQEEAQKQYESLDRQWSRPIAERVANGWAVECLRVEGISANGHDIYQLSCTTNDSRFREGDLLVLHHGNPRGEDAQHVELQYDGETLLEVSMIRGNPVQLTYQPEGWIADQDMFDASPFYLSALDTVADSQRGRAIILPLLQGALIPKMDYARYVRAAETLALTTLNVGQIEAVAQAYAADLLHLIQGPPGTGKTLVLAHLANLLASDGLRVLVTALTHRAIHNALNKIPGVNPDLPVCKIGEVRQAADSNVPVYKNFAESKFGDISGGYVIGATPFATQTNRLKNVEFDVVLFDEASQVTLPLAIMGMLAGNKFIFIGDDKQLPPVTALTEKDVLQKSVFTFLGGQGDRTLLDITYRLNDTLARWPSTTFYDGELKPSKETAGRRLTLSGRPSRWDFVLSPAHPAVFLDLCHRNTTVRSRREAEVAVELIHALLDHGVPEDEIGVVVSYRAQSRLIRSLLRRSMQDRTGVAWERIVVDTVERMQGQEREVILVSFATASPAFALQMADFLFQPQRLNVAVTRPRTKLILIGSRFMLEAGEANLEHAETFELLRSLLDSCLWHTIPDGDLV